jgi:hypothetical protein
MIGDVSTGVTERVGSELFCSDWLEIPLERELAFQSATLLTEADLGFAPVNNGPYGPELVSGFLLLSLLVFFHKKHGVTPASNLYALNYGVDRVRFLTPVMAGQRVRCRAVLTALEPRADGSWRCTTGNTLEVAGAQRPAMVADWITYFAPRPASGEVAR